MEDMENWFDILLIVLELLYELTVDYYIGLNSIPPKFMLLWNCDCDLSVGRIFPDVIKLRWSPTGIG